MERIANLSDEEYAKEFEEEHPVDEMEAETDIDPEAEGMHAEF